VSRRQALILVLAVLTVSWSGPLIRLAKEAPPLAIAFWRTGIATALLAPAALLLHRKEIRRLGRRDLLALALSGAFLALHFATWIASVNLTTVASSALLVGATPVFVAIVSNFIGELSSRREWAGIAVAIAGATLVAGADLGEVATAARGNLLADLRRRVRDHREAVTPAAFPAYLCCFGVRVLRRASCCGSHY